MQVIPALCYATDVVSGGRSGQLDFARILTSLSSADGCLIMNMLCRFLLLALLLMVSSIPPVVAGGKNNPPAYYQTGNQQSNISEQAAIAIAQQHINGRVLAINRVKNSYRIKILSNKGTVHIVSVNSINGTFMTSH